MHRTTAKITSLMAPFFILYIASFSACGPLPRPKSLNGTLSKQMISADVSGLSLISTDANYTSTDIYFYNFGTGDVHALATGESGDVATKWDGLKYWIFNRAAGRVSYSHLSPKQGPTSRSQERATPLSSAYDPADWHTTSSGDTIIALNISNQIIIANLANGTLYESQLGSVDTGFADVPFRPSIILENENRIAVFHQSLDATYQARGNGRVYFASRDSIGRWQWQDQNPQLDGVQGTELGISNPTTNIDCHSGSCKIGGACYSAMGSACKGGIDELNWQTLAVEHIYDLPSQYSLAGGFSKGIKTHHALICLKSETSANAFIHSIDLETRSSTQSWDSGSAYCGSMRTDRAGARIFTIKTISSSDSKQSSIIVLDEDLKETSTITTPYSLSGIDLINE